MSNSPYQDDKVPSPPSPPPLPPQRYAFAANTLARLAHPFGYGPRPSTAVEYLRSMDRPSRLSGQTSMRWEVSSLLPSSHPNPKVSLVPQAPQRNRESPTDHLHSPTSLERTTQHKTGIPIAALDISPRGTHAVLAGRDILKTIQVEDFTCAEDFNLRSNIIAYAATHETSAGTISARHKDQLAAQDVKWSHGNFGNTIATAAANGNIVVYDINRPSVEIARLHEHSRQVHRLGFNPHAPQLMLSGSQDSTVRLWDLRKLAREQSVMTCQSVNKFSGNSDGIRDLRWSPTNGVEFAIGTDNGTIQRWDIRKDSAPLLKINAHEKTCNAVDWHPDGKHIVSGGADQNIKVWDFSSSDRRMKHQWQIRAPQAVVNVRWRPAFWASDKEVSTNGHCTQIATSYDQQETKIHVWDFRRPHVPFCEVNRYDTPATALLWKSESLLWSVGSAGMFTQTDMHFATKTSDRQSPNTFDMSPDGRMLVFLQKRERRRMSIKDMFDDLDQQSHRQNGSSEKISSNHGTTHGSSEEPSLLGSSFKNRQRKPQGSLKPTKSLAGTPPSAGSTGPVQRLDTSLYQREMFHINQAAGIGCIGGLSHYDPFKFYAQEYQNPPLPPTDNSKCDRHHEIASALRYNGDIAAQAGEYQLSGTWKVMAKAVESELAERADKSRRKRLNAASLSRSMTQASIQSTSNNEVHGNDDHEGQMSMSVDGKLRSKNKASIALDDASNMTTPVARPQSDALLGSNLSVNIESLQLSDAVWTKQAPRPVTGLSQLAKMNSPEPRAVGEDTNQERYGSMTAFDQHESKHPSKSYEIAPSADFGDIDRQMTERRAAMENYRAIPRPLLRLDDPFQLTGPGPGLANIDRHDSNESFQLFSASTDSSNRAQSTMGSLESNAGSERTSSTPEHLNAFRDRDQDDTSHEQSALVFDDEASLRSPASSQAFPATNTYHQPKKPIEHPFPPPTVESNYRPDVISVVVHHGDMETIGLGHPTAQELPSDPSHYILSDFDRPKQTSPTLSPWTTTTIFEEIIDYYTFELHDAQLPAYFIIHLAPYLSHSIPFERCNLIVLQYHEQLLTHQLFVEAEAFLNLCDPDYPDVVDKGLYNIASGGPWCTVCQKSSKGRVPNYCERCQQHWAGCPICYGAGLRLPTRPTPKPSDWHITSVDKVHGRPQEAQDLWGWCQECGHGGHTGCLRVWWSDPASEGACPTIGCLCDCVPGTRRDEIVERKEQGRRTESVNRDERYAAESRAVRGARAMVRQSSRGKARGTIGLEATGRSMSGGKKVRIVAPEEEGKAVPGSPGITGKTSASAP